jgi:hypothetical protein
MSNDLVQITQFLKKKPKEICHVQWDHQSWFILTWWSHLIPLIMKLLDVNVSRKKYWKVREFMFKSHLSSSDLFLSRKSWDIMLIIIDDTHRIYCLLSKRMDPNETRCHQQDVFIYATSFLLTIVWQFRLSQWRLQFHFRPGHYRRGIFLRCFRFTCSTKRNSSVVSVRERVNSFTWNSFFFAWVFVAIYLPMGLFMFILIEVSVQSGICF